MNFEKLYPFVMFALAAVVFFAFFLPWVAVESPQVGSITKLLTGKRQTLVDNISGFKVPIMANSTESRLMLSIIKIFNPGITNADKKSFLIWGVPIFALLLAVISLILGKNSWVNLALGITGIAIFAVAVFKISTTDLDKLVLKVIISSGLWLTFYGYLSMGLVAAVRFTQQLLEKNKA